MSSFDELAAKIRDTQTSYFTRIDAIRDLGKVKSPESVAVLSSALYDREQMVRQSAVQALAEIGSKEAVSPLMEVLTMEDDSLHHYAAEALGKIGAAEARPALQQLADKGSFLARSAAKRALERLPEASPRAASSSTAPAGKSPPPLPGGAKHSAATADTSEVARLMQEALKGSGCELVSEQDGARYKVVVQLAGGRHQTVHVATGVADSEGAPLLCIYTYCAPATPDNYEQALRYNMRMSYGALAINDQGGKPMFVMVETVLLSNANADELRKKIGNLARHGDRVEKSLTGKDVH